MSDNNGRQRNQGSEGYGTLAVIAAGAIAGIAGYFLGRNNNNSSPRVRPHEQVPRKATSTQFAPPVRIPDDDTDSCHGVPSLPKECCICLKSFDYIRSKGGQVHATPCGHLFCHYCIYRSLEKNNLCPTCRSRVNREETIPIYI